MRNTLPKKEEKKSSRVLVRRELSDFRFSSYSKQHQQLVVPRNSDVTLIDCCLGHNAFGCSSELKHLATSKLFEVSNSTSFCKYEHQACNLLEAELRAYFRRDGVSIPEGCLFLGHGGAHLLERLFHKLLKPTSLLGVAPQFPDAVSDFLSAGGKYKSVQLFVRGNDAQDSVKELKKLIATDQFDNLYLDRPNNPTGSVLPLEDVETLCKAAEERSMIVVIDEVYGDFLAESDSAIRLVSRFTNLVVVRSFSKFFGLPALRVGYLVMSRHLAQFYREIDLPFEPNLFGAVLATQSLRDQNFIKATRANTQRAKRLIVQALQGAAMTVLRTDERVPILTVTSNKHGNLAHFFAELRIQVLPLDTFVCTCESMSDQFVRIRIPNLFDSQQFAARLHNGPF